jgi:hypothetical protein
VAVRAKQAAGVGLDPGPAGSSADGEVAQPQLGKGETGKIPAVRKSAGCSTSAMTTSSPARANRSASAKPLHRLARPSTPGTLVMQEHPC